MAVPTVAQFAELPLEAVQLVKESLVAAVATTVLVMAALSQALDAALLFASSVEDTYHQ